jgi:uncharacterized protein YaiL (DUF2058 family)
MVIKKTHIGLEHFGRVKQIIKIHELENGDFIKEFVYGTTIKLVKVNRKQYYEYVTNYVKEYHKEK